MNISFVSHTTEMPLTMTMPPDCSAVHMLMIGAMPMVVPWKYTPLQMETEIQIYILIKHAYPSRSNSTVTHLSFPSFIPWQFLCRTMHSLVFQQVQSWWVYSPFLVAAGWDVQSRRLVTQPQSSDPLGESPDVPKLTMRYNLSSKSWIFIARVYVI